jgi:hypothetical protein
MKLKCTEITAFRLAVRRTLHLVTLFILPLLIIIVSAERPRNLWSACAFAGPISTEVTFSNKLPLISIWSRKEMSWLSVPRSRLSWVAVSLSRFFFVSTYSLRTEDAQSFSQGLLPLWQRSLTIGSTRDPGWRGPREYQRLLSRICAWRHPHASPETQK